VQAKMLRLGLLRRAPSSVISELTPHQRQQFLNSARLEIAHLDAVGLNGAKQQQAKERLRGIDSLMQPAGGVD
jgi:hypothetical protein